MPMAILVAKTNGCTITLQQINSRNNPYNKKVLYANKGPFLFLLLHKFTNKFLIPILCFYNINTPS